MINKLKRLLFIIAFLVLMLAGTVYSAYPQNLISYTDGDVTISRRGTPFPAGFGMEVKEGDNVRTGPDATVVIKLENGTDIKLRADTIFTLESAAHETRARLESGGVFARLSGLAAASRGLFTIRARTAVAGVRGTEFFMAYGRTVEDAPDIWLCVNSGEVEVFTDFEPIPLVIREGEGINILAARSLTSPRFYSWTLELNWNMDPEEGPVADQTDLEEAYTDLLDQDYD